jgi:hypothetical protein
MFLRRIRGLEASVRLQHAVDSEVCHFTRPFMRHRKQSHASSLLPHMFQLHLHLGLRRWINIQGRERGIVREGDRGNKISRKSFSLSYRSYSPSWYSSSQWHIHLLSLEMGFLECVWKARAKRFQTRLSAEPQDHVDFLDSSLHVRSVPDAECQNHLRKSAYSTWQYDNATK